MIVGVMPIVDASVIAVPVSAAVSAPVSITPFPAPVALLSFPVPFPTIQLILGEVFLVFHINVHGYDFVPRSRFKLKGSPGEDCGQR